MSAEHQERPLEEGKQDGERHLLLLDQSADLFDSLRRAEPVIETDNADPAPVAPDSAVRPLYS